jgi:hypothetical protein
MALPETVEFALSGTVQGVAISPAHVPFGLMRKFHEEVEQLVLGSNQGSLSDTVVGVRQGSYALVVPLPETVRESFEFDMSVVSSPDSSAHPDPARLAILLGWQKRTAVEKGIAYHVRPQSAQPRFDALTIDAQTTLRRANEDRWVPVELMLLGEVREAGGEKTNIHVRLRDQKENVIVAVSPELLKTEAYPLFNEKLMRVSAERNLRTKTLRKLRLLEFVPYKPEFDEAAFARMTEAGEQAWADVPDAAQWVREQRG